jgi:hypothetical protein
LKELPVLGTVLRKQNQRILNFWVFEKNPNQRIACFWYFKNLKEPLGFRKEQLVGCWLNFLQSQAGAGSFKFWPSPVICQYIYSDLW